MIRQGDCYDLLKTLEDNSIDAVVCDPPYGLGTKDPTGEDIDNYLADNQGLDTGGDFMSKKWEIPRVRVWKEVLRVLKPGGHVIAFAGTRTLDLIYAGMLAGGLTPEGSLGARFMEEGSISLLAWIYSQGFPKSMDIKKAMLKEGIPEEEANKWEGYGTALKPAWEPALTLRKEGPLPEVELVSDVPFLYCAKASKSETEDGVNTHTAGVESNTHPTKKPVDLMAWLIRQATKRGELVLDIYAGSGSTGVAAIQEGRKFLGFELDPTYAKIAQARVDASKQTTPALSQDIFAELFG